MNLDLETLELKGFQTFADEALEISELGNGLHFIRGKNLTEPSLGANDVGKTTLWRGLFWCWFGKTVDGLKAPDIKPWKLKEKTYVTTSLKIDNKPRVISRSLDPNQLTIDGKEVGQEQIDQLLG